MVWNLSRFKNREIIPVIEWKKFEQSCIDSNAMKKWKSYEPPGLGHNFLVLCMLVHWRVKQVYWSVALVDMGLLHLLVATAINNGKNENQEKHREQHE